MNIKKLERALNRLSALENSRQINEHYREGGVTFIKDHIRPAQEALEEIIEIMKEYSLKKLIKNKNEGE